jgi:prepilin-type N-terminal cleavage/methylation domain-containing protein
MTSAHGRFWRRRRTAMLRLRHDDGFSLTELLVVIAVISMLVSLMVGSVMVVKTRAKVRQNEILLQNLKSAVKQMKAAYQYADPIGLDENGEPLDVAGLEAIDIGWERCLGPRRQGKGGSSLQQAAPFLLFGEEAGNGDRRTFRGPLREPDRVYA